jgi:hypothetical protein
MTTEKGKRASRQRWSNKKKAQVLTVMTMVFLMVVIILLPHAFAYEDPAHCYSYGQCYYIGETRGQHNAYSDYWSYQAYNSACPRDQSHSNAYCNGYEIGYNHYWNYLAQDTPRYHHNSGSAYQPQCNIFCSIIKVG